MIDLDLVKQPVNGNNFPEVMQNNAIWRGPEKKKNNHASTLAHEFEERDTQVYTHQYFTKNWRNQISQQRSN